MKVTYIILCLLGIVIPYWQMVPWTMDNGMDVMKMYEEATANRMAAFAWLDAIMAALALVIFIIVESRKINMKLAWLPVAGIFAVGIGFAMPLFLLMRHMHMEKNAARMNG